MSVAVPVISERERQPGGCCTPLVEPDLTAEEALRLAVVTKALADPTRLRIVDALRKASPEAVCQCELLPLFDMSQPALAKHLKVLVAAGVLQYASVAGCGPSTTPIPMRSRSCAHG